ncbi:MAG: hypothetical protein RL721_2274, partial [Candidatus Eisenbacteria bacterium]
MIRRVAVLVLGLGLAGLATAAAPVRRAPATAPPVERER